MDCRGEVVGAFGIHGEIKVLPAHRFSRPFRADADPLSGRRTRASRCAKRPPHQRIVLLKLDGIDEVAAAERLRGVTLWIPEAERMPLDADQFYLHDVVGPARVSCQRPAPRRGGGFHHWQWQRSLRRARQPQRTRGACSRRCAPSCTRWISPLVCCGLTQSPASSTIRPRTLATRIPPTRSPPPTRAMMPLTPPTPLIPATAAACRRLAGKRQRALVILRRYDRRVADVVLPNSVDSPSHDGVLLLDAVIAAGRPHPQPLSYEERGARVVPAPVAALVAWSLPF